MLFNSLSEVVCKSDAFLFNNSMLFTFCSAFVSGNRKSQRGGDLIWIGSAKWSNKLNRGGCWPRCLIRFSPYQIQMANVVKWIAANTYSPQLDNQPHYDYIAWYGTINDDIVRVVLRSSLSRNVRMRQPRYWLPLTSNKWYYVQHRYLILLKRERLFRNWCNYVHMYIVNLLTYAY